jgi:hypothetical protein
MKKVDRIVEDKQEELGKLNNLIFQATKTLTPKGESKILLEGIVDGDGKIELVATQLKQVDQEVYTRTVHLQAFTDNDGKIVLMREL